MTISTRTRAALAAACGAAALFATGCAGGLGADDVPREQAGQVARVKEGVVVEVRTVRIEGTKSGVGSTAGTATGAVIGGQFGGGGAESVVAGIAGAILGGLVGAAAEEGATRQDGYAYTIRLDDGTGLISVVQADETPLAQGARVFVEMGRRARVIAQ